MRQRMRQAVPLELAQHCRRVISPLFLRLWATGGQRLCWQWLLRLLQCRAAVGCNRLGLSRLRYGRSTHLAIWAAMQRTTAGAGPLCSSALAGLLAVGCFTDRFPPWFSLHAAASRRSCRSFCSISALPGLCFSAACIASRACRRQSACQLHYGSPEISQQGSTPPLQLLKQTACCKPDDSTAFACAQAPAAQQQASQCMHEGSRCMRTPRRTSGSAPARAPCGSAPCPSQGAAGCTPPHPPAPSRPSSASAALLTGCCGTSIDIGSMIRP